MVGSIPRHGDGLPVRRAASGHPGLETFAGEWHHTCRVAARRRRLHRQARRRDRHGLVGHAGRSPSWSPLRPRTSTSSSAPPTSACRRATGRSSPRCCARAQGAIPRAAARRRASRPRRSPSSGAGKSALEAAGGGSHRRRTRSAGSAAAGMPCPLQRTPTCSSTRRRTTRRRFRAREDPRARFDDPAIAELLTPRGFPLGASDSAQDDGLLRDVQPRRRHARRPARHADRGDHDDRDAAGRRHGTSSTRSCSRPGSTR